MRKPLTSFAVSIALLGSALVMPPASAAQPVTVTATKQKTKRSPAILAPKAGATVRSHTVTVAVRAPHGIRRADLNGTRIRPRDFQIAADGLRRWVKISSSHGLRHGKNRLRVTINKRYRGTATKNVQFVVRGKRLLVGAGQDRRTNPGSTTTLQASTRRHPSMPNLRPTTNWQIVSAPQGSDATLRRASTRTPRLRTDVPGEYVIKASVRQSGVTTSDTTTVSVPAGPMVPINGWSENGAGTLGISVGGQFYPDSLARANAAWQLLIMDRNTLGVDEGDNRTYGRCNNGWCVGRDGGGEVEKVDMDTELEELGPDKVVILIHRPQYGQSAQPNPFTKAFNIPDRVQAADGEAAAIVAVPGENGGVHTSMHGLPGSADLSGYMMQDRNFNYTFVDDARVPFDSRSKQQCDSQACTVTVSAGDVQRSFTVSNGQAGLAVLSFDRGTLTLRDSQFVLTNGTSPDNIRDNMMGAATYLKGRPAEHLVIVTSVSAPGAKLLGKPSPVIGDVNPVAGERFVKDDPATVLGDAIAGLGGSSHRLLQAGIAGDDGYTLIGYQGLEEGQGNEMRAKQARLTGAFQRDNSQLFVARSVTPSPQRYDLFTATVMASPNQAPWPGAGNASYMSALACLAKKATGLPSDPRPAYWTKSSTVSPNTWNTWALAVRNAQPSLCPDVDKDTFEKVRKQFAKELDYNFRLRQYIKVLQAPYGADKAISQFADLQKWAAELKASSDEVKNKGVQIDWFAIFATAVEMVAPFLAPYLGGKASKALEQVVESLTHALSAATASAIEFGGSHQESSETGEKSAEDDEFNVEVSSLGSEIVKRLFDTSQNLDRMGDVIASDYAKLSRIGDELVACQKAEDSGKKPGDSDFACDASFYTSNITMKKAEVTASHSAEKTIYEKVLPLTYPVTSLPWDGVVTAGAGTPEGNWDASQFTCFNADPFPARWPAASKPFLRRSMGQVHDPNWVYMINDSTKPRAAKTTPQFDTYVIAAFGKNRFYTDTPDETIKRYFGQVEDSTDAADGGLGADPVDFVLSQINAGKVKDYPFSCGGWSNTNNTPAPLDR